MSIMQMHKITLFGLANETDKILNRLQDLGCVHLLPLKPPSKEPEKEPPEKAETAFKALRYLSDVRRTRKQVTDERNFNFETVITQVLNNRQRRREVEDRKDFLQHRINELAVWGNFILPSPKELRDYLLWFYRLPHNLMEKIRASEYAWQIVHKDNRFTYIVIIAKEEPAVDSISTHRTHSGAVPLDELKRHLELSEIELEEIEAEHLALTRWRFLLTSNLARAEDQAALIHAENLTIKRDTICVIQGWVPEKYLWDINYFAIDHNLALINEPPTDDDQPPTLMHNPQTVSGGEDLVSFYQTPAYRGWDPSTIVFFSFSLFFAMILADAGYALVLGAVIAFYWKRLGKSKSGRRFRLMASTVLSASFLYGILVGSFFGISPPDGTLLKAVNILDLNNFDAMMSLSILIGCLHLGLANTIMAYHAKGWSHKAQSLGWLGAIFGGLFYWYASNDVGPAWLESASIGLITFSLILIVLFGSQTKVNSIKSLLLRFLGGLGALTNATKMFGDVLSYLRLFALGLASSSLAITFNQLAVQVQEQVPGLGLLLAILILTLGHFINLALGIISGFVHGLRLNFIEFFNWGISDEGYPFKAFAKKEIKP